MLGVKLLQVLLALDAAVPPTHSQSTVGSLILTMIMYPQSTDYI